jgi:hypothetical protein
MNGLIERRAVGRTAISQYGCSDQSEISNSICPSSTNLDIAAAHRSRSAVPNLMPLTVQLAPPDVFGATRSIMIAIKPLHSGQLDRAASAIANSRAARVIDVRFPGGGFLLFAFIS